MEGSAKETVIIVHGTWAAPEAGVSRWYRPVEGVPTAEGFVSKLDAALQVSRLSGPVLGSLHPGQTDVPLVRRE